MTSLRVTFKIVCTLFLLAGLVSCKDGPGEDDRPAHPAQARAGEFLDALKYGDAKQAAALRLESTGQGFYCQSDKFTDVLEMARAKRSEAECARLSEAKDERLDELSAEARLLVQIVRFSCQHPDGDCADYGQRVLRSHLAAEFEASTFRWRGGGWTIRKVMGDDAEAVVYVDLRAADSQEAAFETLRMKRINDQWFVAESFADNERLPPTKSD
jgi:hypothetical protein